MDYRFHYPALLRWLSRVIDLALAVAGIGITTIVFLNATLRGAAGFDLAWSLEITAFLLLWVTFLGCAAAAARGAHMRVTEIAAALVPLTMQRPLAVTIDFAIVLLLLSLIYYGTNIARHTWAQATTVLYWPVGLLYASMPVGMALTLIFHLYNMTLDVRGVSRDPLNGDGESAS